MGMWAAPNLAELLEGIKVTRGNRKGQILRSFPDKRFDRWSQDWAHRTLAWRMYYLWRMCQFHSGRDVRMPMSAELGSHDPYKSEIDALAVLIYGGQSQGLTRWDRAIFG